MLAHDEGRDFQGIAAALRHDLPIAARHAVLQMGIRQRGHVFFIERAGDGENRIAALRRKIALGLFEAFPRAFVQIFRLRRDVREIIRLFPARQVIKAGERGLMPAVDMQRGRCAFIICRRQGFIGGQVGIEMPLARAVVADRLRRHVIGHPIGEFRLRVIGKDIDGPLHDAITVVARGTTVEADRVLQTLGAADRCFIVLRRRVARGRALPAAGREDEAEGGEGQEAAENRRHRYKPDLC